MSITPAMPSAALRVTRPLPADVWVEMGAAADLAEQLEGAGRHLRLVAAGPGGRLRARLQGPGGLDSELALRDVLDAGALRALGVLGPAGSARGSSPPPAVGGER